jgi:hypothetical protein
LQNFEAECASSVGLNVVIGDKSADTQALHCGKVEPVESAAMNRTIERNDLASGNPVYS